MAYLYKPVYECDRCGKIDNPSKVADEELSVHKFRPKGWVCMKTRTFCSDCALLLIRKKRERKEKEKE